MRTLIYRRWYMVPHPGSSMPDKAKSVEVCATEGEDGVEGFYTRPDGMVEIRMEDPDAEEYWVPIHQVLALITNIE